MSALAAGRLPASGAAVLASGGRDGCVKLWAPHRGQLLLALDTAQHSRGGDHRVNAMQLVYYSKGGTNRDLQEEDVQRGGSACLTSAWLSVCGMSN